MEEVSHENGLDKKIQWGENVGPQSVPSNDVKRRIQRVWWDLFSRLVSADEENDVLRKELQENVIDIDI